MRIRDVLQRKGDEVVTISPDAPITDLVRMLGEKNIGAAVVSSDGTTVDGIVSERDVVRLLVRGADNLSGAVSTIMTDRGHQLRPGRDDRRDHAPHDRAPHPPRPGGRRRTAHRHRQHRRRREDADRRAGVRARAALDLHLHLSRRVPDQADPTAGDGRDETPTERLDRQFEDILQELRVSQAGVQILFAFLLGIAFTPVFADIADWQRDVYIATLDRHAVGSGPVRRTGVLPPHRVPAADARARWSTPATSWRSPACSASCWR